MTRHGTCGHSPGPRSIGCRRERRWRPGSGPTTARPRAADGAAAVFDHARGTNQSGMRLYNERLVLSLIRRHGSLPKAEIARLTGLSAQTVSVIIRQLESDGLLLRRRPHARQDRPALDPDVAQSRRRLLPRPQDRPAQRRPRADRFPRPLCATRCTATYRLSAARQRCTAFVAREAARA